MQTGDFSLCVKRKEPLELRLVFYRGGDGKTSVKYPFLPYFSRDFGHKFHVGRDESAKLARNFREGPFRNHWGWLDAGSG